jgi:5-methylcytosine-specific restriction protein A
MCFVPSFKVGVSVTNAKLVQEFRVDKTGNFRYSTDRDCLVLICDRTDRSCANRWHDGLLHFAGDMADPALDGRYNKIISESRDGSQEIHLFEIVRPMEYFYVGRVQLGMLPYPAFSRDKNGFSKKIWMFPLKMLESVTNTTTKNAVRTPISSGNAKAAQTSAARQTPKKAEIPLTQLQWKFKCYEENLGAIKEQEALYEEARKKFINEYTMQKLMHMTMDEYVYEPGENTSFCSRITFASFMPEKMHMPDPAEFGVYKKGMLFVDRSFGSEPKKGFEKVKEQIVLLRMDGDNMDMVNIRTNMLNQAFAVRLLAVFFPTEYLYLPDEAVVKHALDVLKIKYSEGDDIYDLHKHLKNWNNTNKKWSNFQLMNFAYLL